MTQSVFLTHRWPEVALVLRGIVLRLSAGLTWEVYYSYDFDSHLALLDWFAQTSRLPPLSLSRAAYHPPLYYLLAGRLFRLGVSLQGLAVIGALMGSLRLILFWVGLGQVPALSRRGRQFALALMAVFPTSVLGDRMIGGECLQNPVTMAALLFVLPLFRARGWRRLGPALALGALLRVGLLVKISMLMVVAAVALAAGADLLVSREGGAIGWIARLLPLALCGLTIASISGWYFLRNQRLHEKPVLTSSDAYDQALTRGLPPYLKRRQPSFFVGWLASIFSMPSYQREPRPYFWPVLVASTFVDYGNSAFAPYPEPGAPQVPESVNPRRLDVRQAARLSMAGGTLLALVTALGYAALLATWPRRRDPGELALLLAPLLVLIGQLHFATAYPFDFRGQIKGGYMLLTAPVLCGVLGVTQDWLWQHRFGRLVVMLLGAALALVAYYTLYCRSLWSLA